MNKWVIGGIVTASIVAFLIWLFVASSKPLSGVKQADLSRKHVPVGEKVDYNSNPPTSGDHYSDWIRAGVYSEPKDDRNLIHSLEHGYVLMSYKCSSAVIHEIATPSARNDDQQDCDQRKQQLEKIYEKRGKKKLIVVPRPNLDTKIALTAWNYIDKFDSFDQQRIEKFIDTYRDQGPERTME